MTRLSRFLLLLMLLAGTFGAIEPAVASAHPEPEAAVHRMLPCHSEPPSQKHVPTSHVCCASSIAMPATPQPLSQVQPAASSPRVVAAISGLAGLTLSPRSPPPRG